jgi:hypothetical protein
MGQKSRPETLVSYQKTTPGDNPKYFIKLALISGFRRYVDEICGLLGYYTASCGNYRRFGTTYWSHLHGSRFQVGILTRENGTDTLSRNVGK